MSRRYKWDKETRQLVEIGADWTDAPRSTGDWHKFQYDNLRATDGTPIDSRTKHREYMRAHGLSMASDWTETWDKAAKERDEFRAGKTRDKAMRELIGRIAYQKGLR